MFFRDKYLMQKLFLTDLRTDFFRVIQKSKIQRSHVNLRNVAFPYGNILKCFRIAFVRNLYNASSLGKKKKNPTLCILSSPNNNISLLFQENRNRQIQDNN